ncbi:conserved protein, unknown function [Hepatocystis sp. ex Piliocolobus tephrosceles]|nr:conserved protein, unknown function [Hepatocystis sp. ex Piliocolobus tephrosceles]
MDEKVEFLISIINKWTNKYSYKIVVKEYNQEKREHYYDVTFFEKNENEFVPKYTINAYFIITEIKIINSYLSYSSANAGEKYFVSFKFENENLSRTLKMNLNYEAWIDKLIKDKKKLRNKIDLSSEFMKTRFVEPTSEDNVQKILQKIKEERETARKKKKEEEEEEKNKNKKYVKKEDISLQKKTFYEEAYALDKISSQTDLTISTNNEKIEKNVTKSVENAKLNEAWSILRSCLYSYFEDLDIKQKGKLKQNYYVEILKMVNHKMCISFYYLQNLLEKREKTYLDIPPQEEYFFFESDDTTYSINGDSSEEDNTNDDNLIKEKKKDKKKNSSNNTNDLINKSNNNDNKADDSSKKNNEIIKDEAKYLSELFNINNKEVDLIKYIDLYKNNNFNGYNIFFENLDNIKIDSDIFIFNKNNEYYKYIFTNNYYDFLLYISYANEEEHNGYIQYNNYLYNLPRYLYELKINRGYYNIMTIDDLVLYKQLIYECYSMELKYMFENFCFQFKQVDTGNSGYVHRNVLKKALLQNDHIISRQEYKLLLNVFSFNDDNYVYYKNLKEVVLRLRFEGIKNSIFEKDKKLLQKYLCEELLKHNLKNQKKIHICNCKNVLDGCDKLYLNKNIIHIILCSLNFDTNLNVDILLFLQTSVTIIINSINLKYMQKIYNNIINEKKKKKEYQDDDSKKGNQKNRDIVRKSKEATNIPALELVETTLTKLFNVLDENNEGLLKINDFIETLLEMNQKKKIIDIKEICKLSQNELQGFVAEISTKSSKMNFLYEQIKNNRRFEFDAEQKIHYASHIHKWCSKTYQIRSCEYYNYFMNYPDNLIELDDDIIKDNLLCDEEKE